MGYYFANNDYDKISEILGVKPKEFDKGASFKVSDSITGRSLVLTVYTGVKFGDDKSGNLISVQTQHGYFELHNCSGYIVFEPDEIIFIQSNDEKVSCLIIGKQCSCSMYSNISRELLGADFSELDGPLLLSAMQLSITETYLQTI